MAKTLKDLTSRIRDILFQGRQNLQSWGQVATTPKLRQEYGRYVAKPALQRAIDWRQQRPPNVIGGQIVQRTGPLGQFMAGFPRGAAAYLPLPKQVYQNIPQPTTLPQKIGRTAGEFAGFAFGPGKFFYGPIEKFAEAKLGKAFTQAPKIVRKVLPAVGAEALSSGAFTPIRAAIEKKPLGQTYKEELAAGLTGRAVFGGLGLPFMLAGALKQQPNIKIGDVKIPKALAQEARKYKSAEEYINSIIPKNNLSNLAQQIYDRQGKITKTNTEQEFIAFLKKNAPTEYADIVAKQKNFTRVVDELDKVVQKENNINFRTVYENDPTLPDRLKALYTQAKGIKPSLPEVGGKLKVGDYVREPYLWNPKETITEGKITKITTLERATPFSKGGKAKRYVEIEGKGLIAEDMLEKAPQPSLPGIGKIKIKGIPSIENDFKKVIQPVAEKYNLTNYSAEDYKNFKTTLSPDKTTGYAIKPDGDLVSVFNIGKKGMGKYAVVDAIEEGATKLDTFDGKLVKYYQQFGFTEYKREPNWTPGQPDVVYMKLNRNIYEESKAKIADIIGQAGPIFKRNFRSNRPRVETVGPRYIQPSRPFQERPQPTEITPATKAIKAPEIPSGLKERGFIKTVREAPTTVPEVAEQIKGFYEPITNKETLMRAQSIIDDIGWDAAKSRVFKESLSAETNMMGLDLMRRAQLNKRFDEATEIAEKLALKGTEIGQAEQSFAAWSRLTPEGMLRYATQQIEKAKGKITISKLLGRKPPSLTPDDAETITNLMTKANKATTEIEKAKYVKGALETINNKIPWGVTDILDTYRYNNMLSNPLTHLRNFWSNTINTFIVRPATLAVEGKPSEAVKYEISALKAIPNGFDAFLKTFKGELPIDMAKVDIKSIKAGKAPLALSIPTRAMEATDKFFSAIIQAGETARGRPAEEAFKTAEYFLLRGGLNEAGQGPVLNALDTIPKALYGFRKIPGLGWTIPFIRTPFNWAKMMLEFSPTGIVTIPGAVNKRTQLSKAILGSMATLWGTKMAMEGRTTWRAPTDPTEKELFYASGKKPFSVRIGNKWIPMATFGVFQWALGLPAASQYYQQENRTALTDDQLTKLSRTTAGIIYMWSQSTPMAGLGGFVRLMEGDVDLSFSRNLAFTLGQFKPAGGLMGYIAKAFDPIYRRPKGFVEEIKAGLPIISKQVPAYTEPLTGEPSRRNILDYITPYGVKTAKPEYEPMLERRTEKLQENALINQATKQLEEAKGGATGIGDKVVYWDEETATVKTVSKTTLERQVKIAQYSLDADRYKRQGDYKKWREATVDHIELLYKYQAGLNETYQQPEQIRVQNKIEDLLAQIEKYDGYGGAFKKGKKPAKVTIKRVTIPKISFRDFGQRALPSIKLAKPPKFAISRARPARLTMPSRTLPAIKMPPASAFHLTVSR